MFNIDRMILTVSCVILRIFIFEPHKISLLCDIYKCETGFCFLTPTLV